MKTQNVNNQPNFRAEVISSIRMDRLLGADTIEKLKTKGNSDICHSLTEIERGPNKGKIYFESENEITGRRTNPTIFEVVEGFKEKILECSGISAAFLEKVGKKVAKKKKVPSNSVKSNKIENINNVYELAFLYLRSCKRQHKEEGTRQRFAALVLEKGQDPESFSKIKERAEYIARLDENSKHKSAFVEKIIDMILSDPNVLNEPKYIPAGKASKPKEGRHKRIKNKAD